MGFGVAPDEGVKVLGPDTVAPRAQVDHGEPTVSDEAVGLALADGEPVSGLGDGKERHADILDIWQSCGICWRYKARLTLT